MSTPEADRKKHILLVEDEPGILRSLQLLLEIEHYRVTTASNGRQALERLEDAVPDLVLTDYAMPYGDGGYLIAVIRARPAWKHLPIILMSGMLREGTDAQAQADAVLQKPLTLDRLHEVIVRLLR